MTKQGERLRKLRAAGLCVRCSAPSPHAWQCAECAKKRTYIRRRENGLCHICSAPSEKWVCDTCAKPKTKRSPTKSQWAAADWSMSNKEIATLLSVGVKTVYVNRKKNI